MDSPDTPAHESLLDNRSYFFDDGLQFECLQCGACCGGAPGTIYVTANEIQGLAAFFRLDPADFIKRYLYPFRDSYSVREDSQGRCLFFKDGCRVYNLRPFQCRTFPFWFHYIRSEMRWRRLAGQCPGIGRGRLFSREEILALARATWHL